MELALLVWLVSLLSGLDHFTTFTGILLVVVTAFVGILYLVIPEKEWIPEIRSNLIKYMFLPKIAFMCVFISWIIPSDKTIKYMAAAYLVQTTYESDFVQKATPLAQTAVLNQLESWAKDNKEVAVLLGQIEANKVAINE